MELNVKTIITPESILNGIKFRGETNSDNKTVDNLKDLGEFMYELLFGIIRVKWATDNVYQASGKEINAEILKLRSDITQTLYGEEIANEIEKLVEGSEY